MDAGLLFKGAVIGFSIAAPVGPIGVLCIRRSLAEGMSYGFATGLGAATADAFYGSVAGFGLTVIADFLTGRQMWLSLVGGLFLCWLGLTAFKSRPAGEAAPVRGRGLAAAYCSAVFLTLVNPMTIISFALVFAGLGAGGPGGGYLSAGLLVGGVFSGSTLWWLILSGFASLLKDRFNTRGLLWVNRLAGLILLGFGAAVLWRVF